MKLFTTAILTLLLLVHVAGTPAQKEQLKCWRRAQQCCYEARPCGYRCREGYGYKHCWRRYCYKMVCKDDDTADAPRKPHDFVEWTKPHVTDCVKRPYECGRGEQGMDYYVPLAEEEVPMPSAEAL